MIMFPRAGVGRQALAAVPLFLPCPFLCVAVRGFGPGGLRLSVLESVQGPRRGRVDGLVSIVPADPISGRGSLADSFLDRPPSGPTLGRLGLCRDTITNLEIHCSPPGPLSCRGYSEDCHRRHPRSVQGSALVGELAGRRLASRIQLPDLAWSARLRDHHAIKEMIGGQRKAVDRAQAP